MSQLQPFMPKYGSNQVLSPAAGSLTATIDKSNKQLRVVNTGANIGYFRTYDSNGGVEAATTADCPVPAGLATTVTKPETHDTIAYISASGTTFQVMTGEGF